MEATPIATPTHHVAMIKVVSAVPIMSLGPTEPPAKDATYAWSIGAVSVLFP